MSDAKESIGKILVVEDDTFTRDLLQQELQDLGYETSFLRDGKDALKAVQSLVPDLVLLDVMMPGVDGYSVCRTLRKDPQSANIPIIFITAKSAKGDIVKGLHLGANDYVTKPIDMQILAARVEAQLRVKRLMDRIDAQNKELEILNTKIKEFLGMASHDLRTPTSVIKLVSSTLLDDAAGPLNESQKSLLQKVYAQTQYMSTLLDDLLNYAHIESGKIVMHSRPEDLNALLKGNLSALTFLAEKKEIHLSLEPAPGLPPIMLDRDRFTEIIDNLVSNAIKFTPKGGDIRVKTASESNGSGRWACIMVSDTGRGIPASQLQQIFERFGKAEGKRPGSEERSTGLGLSIAKRLTELHGGKLDVQSKEGKGSCFTVRLPV